LAHAPRNKGDHGNSSEPPSGGHACCEAGSDEEDGSNDVENDGQCFHSDEYLNSFEFSKKHERNPTCSKIRKILTSCKEEKELSFEIEQSFNRDGLARGDF